MRPLGAHHLHQHGSLQGRYLRLNEILLGFCDLNFDGVHALGVSRPNGLTFLLLVLKSVFLFAFEEKMLE